MSWCLYSSKLFLLTLDNIRDIKIKLPPVIFVCILHIQIKVRIRILGPSNSYFVLGKNGRKGNP